MSSDHPADESGQPTEHATSADADDRTADGSARFGATRRRVLSYGAALGAVGLSAAGASAQEDATPEETPDEEATETSDETTATADEAGDRIPFRVRIENVAESDALAAGGDGETVSFSPGVYAAHTAIGPLFIPGLPAPDNGLERLAEDGDPTPLSQSLPGQQGVVGSGVFDTPADADSAGPIEPGGTYEFVVEASPGRHLSFATMFVQSNDLFLAPGESGIALFDETGNPIDGSVTAELGLWDAGTEVNEEPGAGQNQAPRQSGPDTGEDEDEPVLPVSAVDDGYEYPDVSDVVEVTVTSVEGEESGGGATETATDGTETTDGTTDAEAGGDAAGGNASDGNATDE